MFTEIDDAGDPRSIWASEFFQVVQDYAVRAEKMDLFGGRSHSVHVNLIAATITHLLECCDGPEDLGAALAIVRTAQELAISSCSMVKDKPVH
jgi:hypothetical protein